MTADSSPLIRSICVYCGSSPGRDPAFVDAASALGADIADRGLRLVYGGGDSGLMGTVARACLKNGGAVLGVIPQFLQKREQARGTVGLESMELVTVPDMHTRKQMMFEQSDAFVALPGGIGTLEELVEMQTWAQLGRHAKPIAVLDVNGFWAPYSELLAHMNDAGFLHNPRQASPLVAKQASDVLPMILAAAENDSDRS